MRKWLECLMLQKTIRILAIGFFVLTMAFAVLAMFIGGDAILVVCGGGIGAALIIWTLVNPGSTPGLRRYTQESSNHQVISIWMVLSFLIFFYFYMIVEGLKITHIVTRINVH